MNNKLIALAVAAALTVPMAASAAPTVYGLMHLSFGSVNRDIATTSANDTDNWQIRSHASRLGFKGAEEMGNGLTAKYQLEFGVMDDMNGGENGMTATATGATNISARNQWVGLAGGFGEVRIGRHDTPTKFAQGKYDLFGDTDADIVGKQAISQGDKRAAAALTYVSPKIANSLTIAAGLMPGQDVGTGSNTQDGIADGMSVAAMYDAGPLYVSLAHDSWDAVSGSGSLDTLTRLVATYQMGAMTFGALYETAEDASTGGAGDKDVMGVNFKFAMGKNAMKVQYATAEETVGAGTADTETTQLTLGVDHEMSKNTTAYFMYTTAETDAAGSTTSDIDYDFVGVGMVTQF